MATAFSEPLLQETQVLPSRVTTAVAELVVMIELFVGNRSGFFAGSLSAMLRRRIPSMQETFWQSDQMVVCPRP